jgi:hypothetical protein
MASLPKRFLRNYAIYFSVWTVFALFFSSQTIAQKFITGEKTPVSHYVMGVARRMLHLCAAYARRDLARETVPHSQK